MLNPHEAYRLLLFVWEVLKCEITKNATKKAYYYRHYPQTSTSTHVRHYNSNRSCPILPSDHSEEILTPSQIGSWQQC